MFERDPVFNVRLYISHGSQFLDARIEVELVVIRYFEVLNEPWNIF